MSYQLPPVPGAKGPFPVAAKVALCLLMVVSFTLLAFLPPVLLAARRRNRADVVGAAVIGLTELAMMICAGLAGSASRQPANTIGECLVAVMFFGTPVYFLVMDSRPAWARLGPQPAVAFGYPQAYPAPAQPVYGQAIYGHPVYGQPMAPQPLPQPPVQAPPAPQPPVPPRPAAGPTDEFRELGELLRKQAGGDRP